MRILIIHHQQLPQLGSAITGEGLRVQQLLVGLQSYGHVVQTLCVHGYSRAEIQNHCSGHNLDVMIVLQASLVPMLADHGIPIVFDLYAQRIMEAQFEQNTMQTNLEIMAALRASSVVLVSNKRQRWSWQGVLSLLGVKEAPPPLLVVPLSATCSTEEPKKSASLRLVGGGMPWPWQNPWPALSRALQFLDDVGTGEIIWFGACAQEIQHSRLIYRERTAHEEFRSVLLSAHAAFDWMEPNIEREFAIAFRHMDYLGCGLPILTGSYSPLQDVVPQACWISDDIEASLADLLAHPHKQQEASDAAHSFAKAQSPQATVYALQQWISQPSPMEWNESPLRNTIALWQEHIAIKESRSVLEYRNTAYQIDIQKKDSEIAHHNQVIQQQQQTISDLSQSLRDVVAYRKEALSVLGGQIQQKSQSVEDLTSEIAILRADIAKKTAELDAMDLLRERLEHDIQALREENQKKGRLFRR